MSNGDNYTFKIHQREVDDEVEKDLNVSSQSEEDVSKAK